MGGRERKRKHPTKANHGGVEGGKRKCREKLEGGERKCHFRGF